MELMSIGKFAKRVGVNVVTLRRMEAKGELMPAHVSSDGKTCSCCGQIKSGLKLKDRIYICSCGLKIDRDLNASINLANYQIQRS